MLWTRRTIWCCCRSVHHSQCAALRAITAARLIASADRAASTARHRLRPSNGPRAVCFLNEFAACSLAGVRKWKGGGGLDTCGCSKEPGADVPRTSSSVSEASSSRSSMCLALAVQPACLPGSECVLGVYGCREHVGCGFS